MSNRFRCVDLESFPLVGNPPAMQKEGFRINKQRAQAGQQQVGRSRRNDRQSTGSNERSLMPVEFARNY